MAQGIQGPSALLGRGFRPGGQFAAAASSARWTFV
jgi:hypothetical protein